MSRALTRGPVLMTFLRSFMIQASWNYHNMIGNGFAFAVLPVLRTLHTDDPKALDEALRRHLEHFNAHPYLAGLALGATLRLESEAADPETVRRFKTAVRGPLGGLGDSLVWATWLPAVSMLSLALWWAGLPGWLTATVFVLVYNTGHIALRVWAFRTGLREGLGVARALGRANLTGLTRRIQALAALLMGLLVGVVLAVPDGLAAAGPAWAGLATVAFLVGLIVGHRVWRPAAFATVAVVAALLLWGIVR